MKRKFDCLLLCACLIFTVGFGVWVYLRPHDSFSTSEKRAMAQFPSVCAEDLADGDFFRGISDFYGDQFPLRRGFTSLKALGELSLRRRENNGVILGRDGYLVMNPRYGELSAYEENLAAVRDFCSEYRETGIDTDVFFAPRGADVLEAYLPSIYENTEGKRVWKMAFESIPDLISSTDEISEAARCGESVWYRTDHHWTALGAYKCYGRIAERFGKTPVPASELRRDTVSEAFLGSCYSKFGYLGISAEQSFVLRYEGDGEYEITYRDTDRTANSFYSEEDTDGYEVFLGGNYGHISIKSTRQEERETLLLIKDSFANSVVPFLAAHYDIEMYDLRYFNGRLSEEIARIQPDRILILYGIDTAVTDGSLKRLSR